MTRRGRTPLDIAGQQHGQMVAIEPTAQRRNGSVLWRCRCLVCSRDVLIRGTHFRQSDRSHGCHRCARKAQLRARRVEVNDRLLAGETMDRVAASLGVSRQRVEQIVRPVAAEMIDARLSSLSHADLLAAVLTLTVRAKRAIVRAAGARQ